MGDVVVLEWTFSPPDYFEQTMTVSRDEYVLKIGDGKIEARVDPCVYDKSPNYPLAIHEAINGRFLVVQVLTHRAYDLSKPSTYRLHPDGRRDFTLLAEPAHLKITGGSIDLLVKDKDGNILTDTRRDRIEKQQHLGQLAEKYRHIDKVLEALLKSYAAAVRDPDNELVHLYEIREAIATKYSGESAARSAIGVSAGDWSRLGQLANDEPLKQGRHRGKKAGALRDATEIELKEARSVAGRIVEGYLTWLDTNS